MVLQFILSEKSSQLRLIECLVREVIETVVVFNRNLNNTINLEHAYRIEVHQLLHLLTRRIRLGHLDLAVNEAFSEIRWKLPLLLLHLLKEGDISALYAIDLHLELC